MVFSSKIWISTRATNFAGFLNPESGFQNGKSVRIHQKTPSSRPKSHLHDPQNPGFLPHFDVVEEMTPKKPFFFGGGVVFSFTRTCSTRTSITWSASWTSSWARASLVYRSSSIKSVQKGWDTYPSWWAPLPIPTKFRFLPVEPPQNDIISFPHPPLPCPGPGHIGKRNRLPRLHEGKGEGCLHQVAQLWGHHPWEGISIMTKSGDFTPKFQFQPQVWVKPIQHPLNIQYRALPTEEHSVFFPTTEIQQRILIYCIVCWRHRSYKLKYNYDFNTFFLLLGLAGLSQRSGQWLRWLGHRSGGERQCN